MTTNGQKVLELIKDKLCDQGTTTYQGRSGTYKYVEGRTTSEGTINGVVQKLHSEGYLKTAGSFKILEDGTVLRFTGIATKTSKAITKEMLMNAQTQEDTTAELSTDTQESIAV